MRIKTIIPALAAVTAACSQSPAEPPDLPGAVLSTEGYPVRGLTHWASFFEWDEATIAEAAKAELLVLPTERCFSPLGEPIIARLRTLNPDIKIVGYHPVLQVSELYPDTTYLEDYLPWQIEYYRTVEDNWAWTTEGDTLHIWPGTIFLDPVTAEGGDGKLLDSIVDLLERYNDEWPGAIDGIMHDYFMYSPYISPYNTNVEGDPDLDGDGIPSAEDAEERQILLRWQKDFAAEIRSRFGPDFIQIANGRVPQEDAEMAGYLNGIFYEQFPNMCWSLTDREGFRTLLANQAQGWLSLAHGRTWSLLTNNVIEYNNYFCLLSSMLAGCMYAELHGDFLFRGWSIEIDAGPALSDLTTEGTLDSVLTYRRSFARGETMISFSPHGGRREWTYTEND